MQATIPAGPPPDATLCLAMIVKDEGEVISRCLASVRPLIHHWIIADTGSSDDTVDKVENALRGIPGEVVRRPWVDFSHNRNEALELARGKADFVLTIDADEVFTFEQGFSWPALTGDIYAVSTRLGSVSFARGYLLRSSLPWRYEGLLHERPTCDGPARLEWLRGARVMSYGDGGRSRLPNRMEQEVATLEAALAEEPDNSRYRFLLANALSNLGGLERALDLYRQCIEENADAYMVWYSTYQAGLLKERLELGPEDFVPDYESAFDLDPTRAEPLYRLVRRARLDGNCELGIQLGSVALEIPKPEVFEPVDNEIYDYLLPSEYAICLQNAGRYDEAIALYDRLLDRNDLPTRVRVLVINNRRLAEEAAQGKEP